MSIENFPKLTRNQVALLRDDLYTGVVLDYDFNIAIDETQKVYSVFESLDEAIKEADLIVEKKDYIECVIYDKNQRFLKLITPS